MFTIENGSLFIDELKYQSAGVVEIMDAYAELTAVQKEQHGKTPLYYSIAAVKNQLAKRLCLAQKL